MWASYIYKDGGGRVFANGVNDFWITADRNEGAAIRISAHDPEQQGAITYSITDIVRSDMNARLSSNDEIDGDYPTLSVSHDGIISFMVDGDPDWEGGTKINGTRRALTVIYDFKLNVTDASGLTSPIPFKMTFIRRGSEAPPIILDLDGDGLELVSYNGSPIQFDMDADGVRDTTGWVGADDGLLALDRNSNGKIDDVTEISFVGDAAEATSDLEGLRAFDSNSNGFLDAGDDRFREFLVWRDANQDGVSQADELRSLNEAGVQQINLSLNLTGEEPGGPDNVIYGTTDYLASDGSVHQVGDVFFAFDPSNVDTIAAPIVLDYDGDGSGLVTVKDSSTRFDMDGDGDTERTGWITPGDALLALDRNSDGLIAGIEEISFMGDLVGATTDLEGLAAFDSNADGKISALDNRFAEFRLWFDHDSNGKTGAGELLSLSQAGIAEISLSGKKIEAFERGPGSNVIYATGSFMRDDGSVGSLMDAGLAYAADESDVGIAHSGWDRAAAVLEAAEKAVTITTAEISAADAQSVDSMEVGNATDSAEVTLPPPSTRQTQAGDEPSLIQMEGRSFSRKAGAYTVQAQSGQLFVRSNRMEGDADPRSGELGAASLLNFRNIDVGMLSAIVFDLDSDGLETRGRRQSRARFDIDGDGVADDTGWVGKRDGLLVLDEMGDGRITSASELSFLDEKDGARSGMQGLASLDTNKNGQIDAGDARFGELKIWVDRNGNGVTDTGELKGLAEHDVKSINLAALAKEGTAKVGSNITVATSTFTRTDGSAGSFGEVALAFKPSASSGEAENETSVQGADLLQKRLQLLRSGLGSRMIGHTINSGLFAVPHDVNPFDFYEAQGELAVANGRAQEDEVFMTTQDLPKLPIEDELSPESDGAGFDPNLASMSDMRVAQMVQQMASFGLKSGEAEWRDRSGSAATRFDYFAA
jgi:hypothetical protein